MRSMIRSGLLSAMLLLTPAGVLAGPQDVTLTCVRQDHDFTLKMSLGRYTALHFIPHADATAAAFAREYFDKAATVAGVYHVFISPEDEKALKAWAEPFKDEDLMIARDPKNALAAEYKLADKVGQGLPATVVLDPQGHELFRREGTSASDFLAFGDFKKQLDDKWRSNLGEYNLPKGTTVALEGYDPVSYFTASAPAKGRRDLSSEYRAVMYQFATPESRRAFAADPERYLPTYGGWCATALGKKGTKVEVDPTNYKVSNGRLFLFYKSLLGDAKPDWDKHEKEWEPAADKAWKGFSGEDPIKPAARK